MQKKTIAIISFFALLLCGCSQHIPVELDVAEEAVLNAYRAGASRTAPEKYGQAQQSLTKGSNLIDSGAEEKARAALLDTIVQAHEAEIAAYIHQLESTEQQLDSAEDYILRLEEQRTVYFEALSKIFDEQKLSEIKIKESKKTYKPASNYRVRSGENLFAIAARRKVYGDALLWPLLYKANRDQIKDPQQIYPGQVLTIPRDVSEEEKEKARSTARESKIFQQTTPPNGKK